MDVPSIQPFSTIQIIWKDITLRGAEHIFENIVAKYPCFKESVLRFPYPSYLYCTSPLWASMIIEEAADVSKDLAEFSTFRDDESRMRSCTHLTVVCCEISIDDLMVIVDFYEGQLVVKRPKHITLEFKNLTKAANAFHDFEMLGINVIFTEKGLLTNKNESY